MGVKNGPYICRTNQFFPISSNLLIPRFTLFNLIAELIFVSNASVIIQKVISSNSFFIPTKNNKKVNLRFVLVFRFEIYQITILITIRAHVKVIQFLL